MLTYKLIAKHVYILKDIKLACSAYHSQAVALLASIWDLSCASHSRFLLLITSPLKVHKNEMWVF